MGKKKRKKNKKKQERARQLEKQKQLKQERRNRKNQKFHTNYEFVDETSSSLKICTHMMANVDLKRMNSFEKFCHECGKTTGDNGIDMYICSQTGFIGCKEHVLKHYKEFLLHKKSLKGKKIKELKKQGKDFQRSIVVNLSTINLECLKCNCEIGFTERFESKEETTKTKFERGDEICVKKFLSLMEFLERKDIKEEKLSKLVKDERKRIGEVQKYNKQKKNKKKKKNKFKRQRKNFIFNKKFSKKEENEKDLRISKLDNNNNKWIGSVYGLNNLGNTCFFNSVIQCILQTTQMAYYFVDWKRILTTKELQESKFKFNNFEKINENLEELENISEFVDDVFMELIQNDPLSIIQSYVASALRSFEYKLQISTAKQNKKKKKKKKKKNENENEKNSEKEEIPKEKLNEIECAYCNMKGDKKEVIEGIKVELKRCTNCKSCYYCVHPLYNPSHQKLHWKKHKKFCRKKRKELERKEKAKKSLERREEEEKILKQKELNKKKEEEEEEEEEEDLEEQKELKKKEEEEEEEKKEEEEEDNINIMTETPEKEEISNDSMTNTKIDNSKVDSCTEVKEKNNKKKKRRKKKGGEITNCLKYMFNRKVIYNTSSSYSPTGLLSIILQKVSTFYYCEQEDAQELLHYLRFHLKKEYEINDCDNNTLVDKIFGIQMKSTIICHNCKSVSCQNGFEMELQIPIYENNRNFQKLLSRELENVLSLESVDYLLDPVPIYKSYSNLKHKKKEESSLMGCLIEFFKQENLSNENAYYCDRCSNNKNDLKEATKQLSIARFPKVLTIQIKRFQKTGYSMKKNNRKVVFPIELDLSNFLNYSHKKSTNNKIAIYNLYAIVEHGGGLNSGHYISHVHKVQFNNKMQSRRTNWYTISDSSKREVSKSTVLHRASPYLLFYERID